MACQKKYRVVVTIRDGDLVQEHKFVAANTLWKAQAIARDCRDNGFWSNDNKLLVFPAWIERIELEEVDN